MLGLEHELEWKLARAELVDCLPANLAVEVDAIVVERGFADEVALFAIDAEKTRPALAIGTATRGDDAGGKLHRPLHRLLYLGEATALVARRHHGVKMGGLLACDMADGVQRVNAEVHQRSAAAKFSTEPPGAHRLLREEASLERLQLADLARLDDVNGLQPRRVIVNAVADH